MYPDGSAPARIYRLLKVNKLASEIFFSSIDSNPSFLPFRPIVSSIKTYNYNIFQYLCNLLSLHTAHEFSSKNTFSFVNEIKEIDLSGCFVVSYDVTSLFTNIPLNETIDIAIDTILNDRPDLNISKSELFKLLTFATSKTHFLFNHEIYDQIDGVAIMGFLLAPVLANFFMVFYKSN